MCEVVAPASEEEWGERVFIALSEEAAAEDGLRDGLWQTPLQERFKREGDPEGAADVVCADELMGDRGPEKGEAFGRDAAELAVEEIFEMAGLDVVGFDVGMAVRLGHGAAEWVGPNAEAEVGSFFEIGVFGHGEILVSRKK